MKYREVRDCPKCGAHRGFACGVVGQPDCPQLQEATPEGEIDSAPFLWPFGRPPDDPGAA